MVGNLANNPSTVYTRRKGKQPWQGYKYNPEEILVRYIKIFGETGCKSLSVVGSFMGTVRGKIQGIKIKCDGEMVQGHVTIGELMDRGILADRGVTFNQHSDQVYYIGKIASALPFSPMLFIETMITKVNEKDLARVLFTSGARNIQTSLPLSLRYSHAGALPLGPKTRKAHLAWSICFEATMGSTFNSSIYRSRAQGSFHYIGMTDVMDLLDSIEQNIVLNVNEEQQSLIL